MPWVIDTCVLIDIALADAAFGEFAAARLEKLAPEGLVACPVTFVELTPVFDGDLTMARRFLTTAGVDWTEPWTAHDTEAAGRLWFRHVTSKQAGAAHKRPIADVLIAGFAMQRENSGQVSTYDSAEKVDGPRGVVTPAEDRDARQSPGKVFTL